MNKEIGGYFSLECNKNVPFHTNGILLNSGCAALRLSIRARKLKKIYVPEYTCPIVWNAIQEEGCECQFYTIGQNFLPSKRFHKDDYILFNNYFGICSYQVEEITANYSNVIIDNAQAFFMPQRGLSSFYSYRKFFGVPDGGILIDKENIELPREYSQSSDRCKHLLKRWEHSPNEGYTDFQDAEKSLSKEDPFRMSKLTQAMLGNCNYDFVREQRLKNFLFLHKYLREKNFLQINLSDYDVPLVYPFLSRNNKLRQFLIQQKIYVANYWPNVKENCFSNLVALPIDQRYDFEDMKYIIKHILYFDKMKETL